jgi:leader peptidase (prepilin peptidase) / N-methyltransferase
MMKAGFHLFRLPECAFMLAAFAVFCLACAGVALLMLAWIDLKTRLLPNTLVLALALSGYGFHAAGLFRILGPQDMLLGTVAGGGLLLVVREIGNRVYKMETMGLGDVKLMAAAGVWLGPQDVIAALTLGALAGLLHGAAVFALGRRSAGHAPSLARLEIPAGPGFIVGIAMAGLAKLAPVLHLAFS